MVELIQRNPIFLLPIILMICGFIFFFVMLFSSRARAGLMKKQVKAMRYVADESKDDFETIATNMADASKKGVETTARAIKKGLTEGEIYCKYCGEPIDADSVFCKHCGKEL